MPLAESLTEDLRSLVLAPVLFVGIGLLFVVLGLRALATARRFRGPRCAPRPRPRPPLAPEPHGRHRDLVPVLRFTTAEGRQVDTMAMHGRSPAPARAGDRVGVLYDPADPTRPAIDGALGGGCLGTALLGFGLVSTTFALVVGAGLGWLLSR